MPLKNIYSYKNILIFWWNSLVNLITIRKKLQSTLCPGAVLWVNRSWRVSRSGCLAVDWTPLPLIDPCTKPHIWLDHNAGLTHRSYTSFLMCNSLWSWCFLIWYHSVNFFGFLWSNNFRCCGQPSVIFTSKLLWNHWHTN